MYNSQLNLFPDKLRSQWLGSFMLKTVFLDGAIKIKNPLNDLSRYWSLLIGKRPSKTSLISLLVCFTFISLITCLCFYINFNSILQPFCVFQLPCSLGAWNDAVMGTLFPPSFVYSSLFCIEDTTYSRIYLRL